MLVGRTTGRGRAPPNLNSRMRYWVGAEIRDGPGLDRKLLK